MSWLLSALSGLLLALAFPRSSLAWLAWLALVPFFYVLLRVRRTKEALLCGLVFACVFFAIHLAWVLTVFRFVGLWIVLGWLCLTLFQALFILAFVFLVRKVPRPGGTFYPVVAALLWTAVEWLRAWGPFGVTGGDLGYSQAQFLPLIQIAGFFSVYGVSFLIALVNQGAALFLFDRKKWSGLALSLVLVLVAVIYGQVELSLGRFIPQQPSRFLSLALIQPNIRQEDKNDPKLVAPTFRLQEEMSQQALKLEPDILIWPETAVFAYLLDRPALMSRLKQLAAKTRLGLIFGTPYYYQGRAYNAVVSLSPSGEVTARYDKQHRVPFGEYLPFRPLLYPWLRRVGYYESDFSEGRQLSPLRLEGLSIATAVCFESTFPYTIKQRTGPKEDIILLVTNDAWFLDSSALYFHLNTGVFRAIENRKYFVQAGNTGFSALIDPYGRLLKRSKLQQQQILRFQVPLS
ncbi:MAG: apolipoprotein N-acyltransferase [Candidatus Saganbacteria bacterium]|nr:apolipoprotein N-acyltransferase [Candidatus Saganbacteria bacterium]